MATPQLLPLSGMTPLGITPIPSAAPERMTPEEVRGLFMDMIHILTEQNLVIIKLREIITENDGLLKHVIEDLALLSDGQEGIRSQNNVMRGIILRNHGINPDEQLGEPEDYEPHTG